MEPLPPLNLDPIYGYFPWWPENGDGWLHPEDVPLARRTIPGPRVWRREGHEGAYAVLHYGADRLRVKPALWCEAPRAKFDLGELVEVLPHGLQHEPATGVVRELLWDEHEGELRYQLEVAGRLIEKRFAAHDLKHVDSPRPEVASRIEPSGEEPPELAE